MLDICTTRWTFPYRIGRLEQVAGVRLTEGGDGAERGVRLLRCSTGAGFEFEILVDRGFDVGGAWLGGRPVRFDEEHGVFAAPEGSPLRVGDSVALVPGYSPTTVNWYDAYHVVRDDTVVDIWPVIPRGPGHHGLAPA